MENRTIIQFNKQNIYSR